MDTAPVRTREGACDRSAQSDRRGIGGVREAVWNGSRVGQARKAGHLDLESEGGTLGDDHGRCWAVAVAASVRVGGIWIGGGSRFALMGCTARQFDPVPVSVSVPIISLGMEMDAQRQHHDARNGHTDGGVTKRMLQNADTGAHQFHMLQDVTGCQSLPVSWLNRLAFDHKQKLCYFIE